MVIILLQHFMMRVCLMSIKICFNENLCGINADILIVGMFSGKTLRTISYTKPLGFRPPRRIGKLSGSGILLLLLISSNNRIGRVGGFQNGEKSPAYVISVIENYWNDSQKVYVKLSESKGICFFRKDSFADWEEGIAKAGDNCMPLLFRIHDNIIMDVKKPDDDQVRIYLGSYDSVKYYEPYSLESNPSRKKYFSGQISKDFFSFLGRHYAFKGSTNLDIGCEARAGIIAKFLNEETGLSNYKLFLSGKIKFQFRNTSFFWINHAVNLIAFKNGEYNDIYVFDPFMLKGMMPVHDYFARLLACGSRDLRFRITDNNVFVCFMNCGKGIIDTDYYYAGTIFSYLSL